MRTRPLPRNFASGELAPWVDGITNELTQKGARTLENFIVKKQGQALRRPGMYFVDEVKTSANATALVPVTIDDDNTYVLEIGDAYIRFYKNHARVLTASGTIYEVTSPWSTGELSTLGWEYIPDEKAIYFDQPSYPLNRLKWASDASWTLEQVPILQNLPPFVLNAMGGLATSDDLRTWEEKRITLDPANTAHYAIARGKENLIVFGGGGPTLLGDRQGDHWISLGTAISTTHDIEGTSRGELVAVGSAPTGSSGTIHLSSDDGYTWVSKTGPASGTLYAVAYDVVRDHWMAVGVACRMYAYSFPGPYVSATEISSLFGLGYGSDLWIAVGTNTIKYAGSVAAPFTSVAMTGTLYGITKGNPNGTDLWIAVGMTAGSNAVIYSSPTGTVWTQRYNSNAYAATFSDVRWIGHMYLAVGGDQGGAPSSPAPTIWAFSYDGITWTVDTTMSKGNAYEWFKITNREEPNITDLNISANFPKKIGQHEGRLNVVPKGKPAKVMGSASNKTNNFFLGPLSSDAWEYELASGRNVDIQWLMGGMGGLVVGTRTAEGILIGSPDEGITPLTAQFRWLSTFGSANIQPIRIHDTIIFVQRGGEIIRGYKPTANAFESPDLTAYADHIAKGGVTELDHQDDPQSMVYAVRTDGQLLALTFDNNLRAWSRIKAAASAAGAAVIESVAIVPTTGAEDEIWLIVKRTIGGSTKRYIEYMDTLAVASFAAAHYVDSGVYVTSGTSFQIVGGLTHLAGENVDAFISAPVGSARWIQALTVAASGTITTAPYSGTSMHVGLPYSSYLQTMRGDYGSPWGDGAGLNKKTSRIMAWVHDSSALAQFGPVQSMTLGTTGEQIPYSASGSLMTEMVQVNFPGGYDNDNYIWIAVHDPRPFTLVAMLPDSETGDR